jgi:hypothetical protein
MMDDNEINVNIMFFLEKGRVGLRCLVGLVVVVAAVENSNLID